MITNSVTLKIVDSPSEAPDYKKLEEEYTLLQMKYCYVIANGTQEGNVTVDIQLVDEHGKKYVIMATGRIINMIAIAINSKQPEDKDGR